MFSNAPGDVDTTTGAWRPLARLALAVTGIVAALTAAPDVLGVSGALDTAGPASGVLSALAFFVWLLVCFGTVVVAETRPRAGLVAALAVTLVSVVAAPSTPLTVFVVLGAVAVVTAWRDARASLLASLAGGGAVVAWVALGRPLDLPLGDQAGLDADRWGPGLLVLAGLLVLHLLVRSQRREQRLWLDRTVLEAREGRVAEREGVVAERARLARDLHDVVAHHVSLIAVRAETAPYTHPDLDPAARTVLTEVATDARLALDELRGVLGILGRSQDDDRSPQPGWAEVQALVERTRGAGVEAELTGDLAAPVPPSVGYVAYRVVQEALTNARRHAPGQPVSVTMRVHPDGATVTVRNAAASAVGSNPSGRGLAGMRERVEGLGGRLTVGPRGEEFVVEAVFGAPS